MHKKFVPRDFNHVRLLRQKQNILTNLFINISRIVGISRRNSCILFTYKCIPMNVSCPPRPSTKHVNHAENNNNNNNNNNNKRDEDNPFKQS